MRNVLAEDLFDAISIEDREIYELRYADDTLLLSTNRVGLSRLLESNRHHSEEARLLINISKTKLMRLDMRGISMGGQQMEEVTKYQYLGIRIQNDGDNFQEVRKRMAIGIRTLCKLWSLWKDTDVSTRVKVLKSIIFPVATYGCESQVLIAAVEKRVTAFEN